MGGYQAWKGKQAGKKVWLASAFFSFTAGAYAALHFYYFPWAKRERLRQAEEYANILLQREKPTGDQSP